LAPGTQRARPRIAHGLLAPAEQKDDDEGSNGHEDGSSHGGQE